MSDDLEDLAIAVGVLQPPARLMPLASEWAAGLCLTALATVAVISGSSLWGILT